LKAHRLEKEAHQVEPQSKFRPQFVNGLYAPTGMFPFVVAVYHNSNATCAGTILNEEWVLTSAFCTASILSSDYTQVLAGTNDIETLQDGAQWRTVDWIVQHPSWDSSRTRYALSLLHVSSPFNITATVKPVHIVDYDFGFPGWTTVTVMGWGSLNAGQVYYNQTLEQLADDLRLDNLIAKPDYTINQTAQLRWHNMYILDEHHAEAKIQNFFGAWTMLSEAPMAMDRVRWKYADMQYQLYTGSDVKGSCDELDDGSPVVIPYTSGGPNEASYQIVGVNLFRYTCTGSVDIHSKIYPFRDFVTGAKYYRKKVDSPYLRVALWPTKPAVAVDAKLFAVLPGGVTANEVHITLPYGYTINENGTTAVSWLLGPVAAPDSLTYSDGVIVLGWTATYNNNFTVPNGNTEEQAFILSNLRSSGNCFDEVWTVTLKNCWNTMGSRVCSSVAENVQMQAPYASTGDCSIQANNPQGSIRTMPTASVPTECGLPAGHQVPTSCCQAAALHMPFGERCSVPFSVLQDRHFKLTCAKTWGSETFSWGDRCQANCLATCGIERSAAAGTCMTLDNMHPDFYFLQFDSCDGQSTMDSPVLYTTLNAQYGLTTGAVARYDPATDAENLKFALAEWVNATTLTSQVDSYNIRIVSVAADSSNRPLIKWQIVDVNPVTYGAGAVELLYIIQNDPSSKANFESALNTFGFTRGAAVTVATPVVTVENYAPSITGAAMSVSTSEDVAVTLPDVVVTDDAPETDTLQLDVSVDYGLVALGSTTGLTSAVTPGSVAAYSVTGTIEWLNAALSGMTYTPPKDWYGTATVSFTIHDMGFPSPSIGGSMSANTTLSVTVAAVNDAPTVTILSYPNVTEDTTLNIADLFVTDVDAYSGLLNVSVRTEKGTFTLGDTTAVGIAVDTPMYKNLQGNVSSINMALMSLAFTPTTHFFGTAYLIVEVDDQGNSPAPALQTSVTIPITVTSINDVVSLVLTSGYMDTNEDVPTAVPPMSVVDVDMDNATAVINCTVLNGTLGFGTLPHMASLVAVNKFYSIKVEPSYYSSTTARVNQILSSITYTSDLNWYGYDVLSVTVSDDHHTTPYSYASMVNITVHAVNDAPTVSSSSLSYMVNRWYNVSIPITIDDVDAYDAELQVQISCQSCKLSVVRPENVTNVGYPDYRFSVLIPSGSDGMNVDNLMLLRGPLQLLNAALATLVYQNTNPFVDWIPVMTDLHDLDQLSVNVTDLGASGSGGALEGSRTMNITVTAELYDTCAYYLERTPSACGCYFKVNASLTDTVDWTMLPTDFPSVHFFEMIAPNRFVLGCCADIPTENRTMLSEFGHLSICENA